MEKDSKIYIAGHRGMVGSAIHRRLKKEGYENFVFRTSEELDLKNQQAVADFFAKEKLGWQPKYTLQEMVKEMVACDLELFRKHKILLEAGFHVLPQHE